MISDLKTLAQRIAEGDEIAFRQFFDAYHPRSVMWANHYLRSPETAEEVAADVFVSLWRRRQSIAEVRNLQSYLYTSVRNGALDHLRRSTLPAAQGADVNPHASEADNPENILVDAEYYELIRRAIDSLPGRCRQVFTLTLSDHLKQNETARRLGISVKTVEAQVAKAYKRIATHVREQYDAGV